MSTYGAQSATSASGATHLGDTLRRSRATMTVMGKHTHGKMARALKTSTPVSGYNVGVMPKALLNSEVKMSKPVDYYKVWALLFEMEDCLKRIHAIRSAWEKNND